MDVKVFILVSCLYVWARGSDINLTKSPDSIKPFLTHSLSLRCSLSDSVWQVLTTSPSPLVIGKRGQQGSDDNIRFVTSLVVSRDGQDVASVSDYVPAKAVSGENNLQVQGAVSKTAGERGYLSLTWSEPSTSQAGNYSCVIHGIDDQGHSVTFTAYTDVQVAEVSMTDLLEHIHKLEMDNLQQQAILGHVAQQVEDLQHVEQGKAVCGNTDNWVSDKATGTMRSDVTVKFAHPYKSAPLVHLGVQDASINHNFHAYFTVNVVRTDQTGFTVRCTIRDNGGSHHMSALNVGWISLSR